MPLKVYESSASGFSRIRPVTKHRGRRAPGLQWPLQALLWTGLLKLGLVAGGASAALIQYGVG